ncbi:MAG: BTAD domain-containing putative transcriptional regulator [Micropruina sp.]
MADAAQPTLRALVLGEPTVVVGGVATAFPAGRPGELLAVLLLARGRTVSTGTLIDRIWSDDDIPAEPRAALHTIVRRLRRALGEAWLIVQRPPGYALPRESVSVDAEDFAVALTAAIGSKDLGELEDVLAGWRGEPWGGFASDAAAEEVRRLRTLAHRARTTRADLLLRDGRHPDAVAQARDLVAEAPLASAPVAVLMRALAASGDVAEALAAFREHRRRLADEQGLDPSAVLLSLQQEILRGEPGAAPRPTATDALPAPVPSARPRPRRLHGRDAHLRALAGMLEPGRCVTVVGPGGVGKTAVAAKLCADAPGPAWWVDLAELRSESELVPAVAGQVGVRTLGGDQRDGLLAALRGTRGLLVLDNCEHLLGSVAELVETVLAPDAEVAVLATSRERLGTSTEQAFPLPPLQLPGPARTPASVEEAVAGSPAVAFFVERATAADPGLVWDAAAVRDVTELVIELDGLPLAIELAAGRSAAIGFAELRERLSGHLDLIRSGAPRLPSRHRTLTATLDWSYRLLPDAEQEVFRGLAVFAGWFDLAAVDAVLGTDAAAIVPDLVERSLLVRKADGGTSRYRMLVTIRSFAAGASGDRERRNGEAAHGTWALGVAERAASGLEGPDEAHWAEVVDAALPDLAAAFGNALAADDTDLAAALVGCLHRWGDYRVRPDVLGWSAQLLVRRRDCWPPGVYLAAATHAWMQGNPRDGLELADLAVRAAREVGSPLLEGRGHEAAGDLWLALGDLDAAAAAYRRAERAATAAGHPSDPLMAADGVLLALAWSGAPVAGQVRRVLDALPAVTNPTARSLSLYCVGEAWASSDPAAAVDLLTEAVGIAEQAGCTLVVSVATTALMALVSRSDASTETDLTRLAATVQALIAAGNRNLLVTLLRNLASLLGSRGQHAAALELLAALEVTAGQRPSWGDEADALRSVEASARTGLDADAVRAARLRGQARSLTEAAREAVRALT